MAVAATAISTVSLVPTLVGRSSDQAEHEYLYWEFGRGQAVRLGDWKGIRFAADRDIELYNLAEDIAEQDDVAAANPDIVARIEEIMRTGRTESELVPLVRGS